MREMEPTVSAVPYQVCVGNHEHYYNFSGYRHRFSMGAQAALPESGDTIDASDASGVSGASGDSDSFSSSAITVNNLFHSFDVGGVHFAAFSTEHDYSTDSPQVAWLQKDLAAVDRKVTPWVVVFGHKPLYCSTDDYYDCKVSGPQHIAPSIEPLLKAYHVDLYLAGHLHNYVRLHVYLHPATPPAHSAPIPHHTRYPPLITITHHTHSLSSSYPGVFWRKGHLLLDHPTRVRRACTLLAPTPALTPNTHIRSLFSPRFITHLHPDPRPGAHIPGLQWHRDRYILLGCAQHRARRGGDGRVRRRSLPQIREPLAPVERCPRRQTRLRVDGVRKPDKDDVQLHSE